MVYQNLGYLNGLPLMVKVVGAVWKNLLDIEDSSLYRVCHTTSQSGSMVNFLNIKLPYLQESEEVCVIPVVNLLGLCIFVKIEDADGAIICEEPNRYESSLE